MAYERAQRLRADSLAGSAIEEFRRQDTIVNVQLGTRVMRHAFVRQSSNEPTAEHFVHEVMELVESLEQDPSLQGREFYNYIFTFVNEEGRFATYSLDKETLSRLGPAKAIEELVKIDYKEQTELYKYGSGDVVMMDLQNRRLYTRRFEIFSSKELDSLEAAAKPGKTKGSKKASDKGKGVKRVSWSMDDTREANKESKKLPSQEFDMRHIRRPLDESKSAKYIGFDFETIIDREWSYVKPYAVSAIVYDDDEVEIKRYTKLSVKSQEIKEFVVDIIRQEKATSEDENVYLIGFNNANFDNFLLYELAVEFGVSHSEPFVARSALLGLKIEGIEVKDLLRFVMKPLKEACEDFGCKLGKGELKHQDVQLVYYQGDRVFEEYLRREDKRIREYVEMDVESMMELFFKCKKAYHEMTSLHIEDYMTLAGLTYEAFQRSLPEEVWDNRPKMTKALEEYIRAATYGGRSQVFKPKSHTKKRVAEGDVVSLYPYVMVENLFPMGEEKRTKRYIPGKIGVYRVKILKQPALKVIPQKQTSSYNWTCSKEFDATVGNISLEDIKAHGGKFEVVDGVYWEESRDIFSAYINPLYEVKRAQDAYKEAGDKRYNPSLRNIVKLLMNALSGKVIQRTYTEHVRIIETRKQWEAFRRKVDTSKKHQIYVQSNTAYVVGTLKEEAIRRDIPIIWGVMIYEYSRSYMYNKIYTQVPDIIFTETDSFVTRLRYIKRDMKSRPWMYGDKMGQLTTKFHTTKTYCVSVTKKCSCLYDAKTKEILKGTFKGVNRTKDKVVDEEVYKSLATDRAKFEYYHDKTKGKPVGLSTYLDLTEGKNITIMCGQLARKLRPNANIEPLAHIVQVFRLKHFPRDDDDSDYEEDTTVPTGDNLGSIDEEIDDGDDRLADEDEPVITWRDEYKLPPNINWGDNYSDEEDQVVYKDDYPVHADVGDYTDEEDQVDESDSYPMYADVGDYSDEEAWEEPSDEDDGYKRALALNDYSSGDD